MQWGLQYGEKHPVAVWPLVTRGSQAEGEVQHPLNHHIKLTNIIQDLITSGTCLVMSHCHHNV